MSIGSDLLNLQELDLELSRTKTFLAEMPELVDLARRRKKLAALKTQSRRAFAVRKDAETELADLDAQRRACEEGVAAAQARPLDASDYRQVQELEDELASFAKRLDRIEHLRVDAVRAAQEARDKESQVNAYIARFEEALLEAAKTTRERAEKLKAALGELQEKREHMARRLPAETLATYDAAMKRFGGLAVERLEGHMPSICRTTLQPASMDTLRRAGELAECPYCHRMLVVRTEDE